VLPDKKATGPKAGGWTNTRYTEAKRIAAARPAQQQIKASTII
jgi:hypothetical protein